MTGATTAERSRRTKPSQTSPPADDTFIDRIANEQSELARAGETLMERLADGQELSSGQWGILRRIAPETFRGRRGDFSFKSWLDSQLAKVKARRDRQRAAGTSAEREAARKAAEEAATVLTKRSPEIEAEIQRLQGELGQVEQSAHRAAAEVASREQAVELLRDESQLPEQIRDELRALRLRHVEQFGRELSQLRGRLQAIDRITAFDPSSDDGLEAIRRYVESNRALGGDTIGRLQRFFVDRHFSESDRELVDAMESGQIRLSRSFFASRVKPTEWRAHCETLRREAAELAPRLAELEELESAAAAEIEKLRNHLVPKSK
jgi:small-conductance mechanosensitive channel